jgi:hypothetical protein
MNQPELAKPVAEEQKKNKSETVTTVTLCLSASGWQQIGTESDKQALVFSRKPKEIRKQSSKV